MSSNKKTIIILAATFAGILLAMFSPEAKSALCGAEAPAGAVVGAGGSSADGR